MTMLRYNDDANDDVEAGIIPITMMNTMIAIVAMMWPENTFRGYLSASKLYYFHTDQSQSLTCNSSQKHIHVAI